MIWTLIARIWCWTPCCGAVAAGRRRSPLSIDTFCPRWDRQTDGGRDGRWIVSQTLLRIHTHPLNGHFSGTNQVSRYQKGKTNLDFTEASDSGIIWAICKSAPCSRQTTTPAPHHSVFTGFMPFLPPNNSVKALKAKNISSAYYGNKPVYTTDWSVKHTESTGRYRPAWIGLWNRKWYKHVTAAGSYMQVCTSTQLSLASLLSRLIDYQLRLG